MHTALRAGARPLPRPRKPSAIQFIPHGLIGQDIHLAIFSFFTVLRLYCHFQSVAPEPEVPCASASKKLMWLKVTVPWYKTFKNFSRLFHCSVINVLFPVAFYLSDATFIRYHIFCYLSTGFFIFSFLSFSVTEFSAGLPWEFSSIIPDSLFRIPPVSKKVKHFFDFFQLFISFFLFKYSMITVRLQPFCPTSSITMQPTPGTSISLDTSVYTLYSFPFWRTLLKRS